MRERTCLWILFIVGALIINAGPAWSQSVEGEKDGLKKDQEKGQAGSQVQTQEKTTSAGASGASVSISTEEIKQIQLALKEQGHDPGPADGILGSKTQQALKSYQQSKGLQATGRLDAETKMQLGLKKDTAGEGKSKPAAKEGSGSEVQSEKSGNQGQSQKGAGEKMEKGTQ